jgi:hypothetical protein
MGYTVNKLTNLPLDDEVDFYIFVINGEFDDPLYAMIEKNFKAIARSIGDNAVIVQGTDPVNFTSEVQRTYLGKHSEQVFRLLPALVITDTHPEEISDDSLRLIVPLSRAEETAGGWPQFFKLLSQLARKENSEFLNRFPNVEDVWDKIGKYIKFEPQFFGVRLEGNEVIKRLRERSRRQGGF